MPFADQLNEIANTANSPKEFFNPNRVNRFISLFMIYCKEAAERGKYSLRMTYIEDYEDSFGSSYDRTILIVPKLPDRLFENSLHGLCDVYMQKTCVLEDSFPLKEVVNTLNTKLKENGFKNIKVDIVQRICGYRGKIIRRSIAAKVIIVSVSW